MATRDRGQADVVPIPFVLGAALALAVYVGAVVLQHLQGRVTSDSVLCAGGCGVWIQPGIMAGALVALILGVAFLGPALKYATSSSEVDDEQGA